MSKKSDARTALIEARVVFERASEDSAKELTETCAIVRAAWGIPRT